VNRRTGWAIAAAAAVVGAITVPVAMADDQPGHSHGQVQRPADEARRPLGEVRDATRAFRDVDKAIAAGYVQFFGCVHEPLAGSMGIHFVNGGLVGDAVIEAAKPEALMYEPTESGDLALVGVEYVVFQDAWDNENAEPPSLFGQPFTLTPSPNRYGIPAFYELHAWAWESNPTGTFTDWNPRVLCTGTEGHTH
jgi:hypothetical protein